MDLAHAADVAYAAGQPPGGGGSDAFGFLFLLLGTFAIFYFLIIRPQQKERKKREEILATLKKGDRVATTGGLHGTIVGLNEQTVILKIADQVKVEVDRSAISRVVAGEPAKDA